MIAQQTTNNQFCGAIYYVQILYHSAKSRKGPAVFDITKIYFLLVLRTLM